jgi:hypothetical protein
LDTFIGPAFWDTNQGREKQRIQVGGSKERMNRLHGNLWRIHTNYAVSIYHKLRLINKRKRNGLSFGDGVPISKGVSGCTYMTWERRSLTFPWGSEACFNPNSQPLGAS